MILIGDGRDVLPGIPDNSIDAVGTDPLFGLNDGGATSKMSGIYAGDRWQEFEETWDTDLCLWWIPHAARVLKPGGAVLAFTDALEVKTLWRAYEAAGIKPLRIGHWCKTNPPTNPRKNYRSGTESWVFGRMPGKVLHWHAPGVLNYMIYKRVQGKIKFHPTQKPVPVLQHLISPFMASGAVLLDPFAGSAAYGEAVISLDKGCRYIGIDEDAAMANRAQRRLDRCRMSDTERKVFDHQALWVQEQIQGQGTLWES